MRLKNPENSEYLRDISKMISAWISHNPWEISDLISPKEIMVPADGTYVNAVFPIDDNLSAELNKYINSGKPYGMYLLESVLRRELEIQIRSRLAQIGLDGTINTFLLDHDKWQVSVKLFTHGGRAIAIPAGTGVLAFSPKVNSSSGSFYLNNLGEISHDKNSGILNPKTEVVKFQSGGKLDFGLIKQGDFIELIKKVSPQVYPADHVSLQSRQLFFARLNTSWNQVIPGTEPIQLPNGKNSNEFRQWIDNYLQAHNDAPTKFLVGQTISHISFATDMKVRLRSEVIGLRNSNPHTEADCPDVTIIKQTQSLRMQLTNWPIRVEVIPCGGNAFTPEMMRAYDWYAFFEIFK